MTCREKMKLENPMLVGEDFQGGCAGCPDAHGYYKTKLCEGRDIVDPSEMYETCTKCWDREVEER